MSDDLFFTVMNKVVKSCIKERILQLARLRSTGPPAELAGLLKISARSIKRIIKELRDEGFKVKYDRRCLSYVLL